MREAQRAAGWSLARARTAPGGDAGPRSRSKRRRRGVAGVLTRAVVTDLDLAPRSSSSTVRFLIDSWRQPRTASGRSRSAGGRCSRAPTVACCTRSPFSSRCRAGRQRRPWVHEEMPGRIVSNTLPAARRSRVVSPPTPSRLRQAFRPSALETGQIVGTPTPGSGEVFGLAASFVYTRRGQLSSAPRGRREGGFLRGCAAPAAGERKS